METGRLLSHPKWWGTDVPPPDLIAGLPDPHVKSFDWLIERGLQHVVDAIETVEIEDEGTGSALSVYLENPYVIPPRRTDAKDKRRRRTSDGISGDTMLFPKDCRIAGKTYAGEMFVTVSAREIRNPARVRLIDRMIADGGESRPDPPAQFVVTTHTGEENKFTVSLGDMPVMVKSRLCHLRDRSQKALIERGEEPFEFGGYFICNGIERIVRLLMMQRRHYIMAVKRATFKKRGPTFSEYGVYMRCCRADMSAATVKLHYMENGEVNLAFSINRREYFVPVGIFLKALWDASDKMLYEVMCSAASEGNELFYSTRAEIILKSLVTYGLNGQNECIEFLGKYFRSTMELPKSTTNFRAGIALMRRYLFIHCHEGNEQKAHVLVMMIQKLFAFVCGTCQEDNPDCLAHHEILLPGHILASVIKDQLETLLRNYKATIEGDLKYRPDKTQLYSQKYQEGKLRKTVKNGIGAKIEYFLNTGNLTAKSIEISQSSGFTVVAEKLNWFRYLSHFRAVHRGAYFATLPTTKVRKLLPESWGFMCPVHTPDGAPCGLLNHLTAKCEIVTSEPDESASHTIAKVLAGLGMNAMFDLRNTPPLSKYLPVVIDGCLVGHVRGDKAKALVADFRMLKCDMYQREPLGGQKRWSDENADVAHRIDPSVEIAHIPFCRGEKYPGVFLYTNMARLVRPVYLLDAADAGREPDDRKKKKKKRAVYGLELVGTLEQSFLNVHCPDKHAPKLTGQMEFRVDRSFSHAETSPTAILSLVASLTPWSDLNQSPRNMYQCQMAKQTMGTPLLSFPYRFDNKLYRLNSPQTPISATNAYAKYDMDEYASGTNAIVAVLSYTGYDMEDAMVINKSSMERGFGHGTMYKSAILEVDKSTRFGVEGLRGRPMQEEKPPMNGFGDRYPRTVPRGGYGAEHGGGEQEGGGPSAGVKANGHAGAHAYPDMTRIDVDGLPHVGATLWPGDNQYSMVSRLTGRARPHRLTGEEVAMVDQVAVLGGSSKEIERVNLKLRYRRNPVIGDKFASRHGQKGILSFLYPDTDMPWSEMTGMRPDIIFNPHGFPSRMTIGMIIESLASKAGALLGEFKNATPFAPAAGDNSNLVDKFGEELLRCGFHKNGTEKLISGITGEEMEAEIYVGVVYYQRLRHMVSDKFQVRSTGAVDQYTRQPLKGRKKGGGIRFGEMERDALISHGVSYLCYDRLHLSSDYFVGDVCMGCGQLISTTVRPVSDNQSAFGAPASRPDARATCLACDTGDKVRKLAFPYVFKYLVTELASVNIKCVLDVGRFGSRGGVQHT